MFRYSSVVCGVAIGSMVGAKCLNYFTYRNELNAENAGLQRTEDLDLKLVQVFFRHGARTPMKLIPGLEETVWDKNELRRELEHTKLSYELRNLKGGGITQETSSPKNELRVMVVTLLLILCV